ncbi:MAG: PQQ-dependent sugar dehydrogenase [Verrucomicrobia bacterium]|nr:PQQ-dependent sugar dehydrogenase [Verrucomicrobiota bacterium]MBI3869669.1 PQQ-dependent sugar dehydrogenase [Verrucomicrobiota bacterium]
MSAFSIALRRTLNSLSLAALVAAGPTNAAEPASTSTAATESPTAETMERGRQVYAQNCFICHQLNGQGLPGTYPPLAGSDYLMADIERSIRAVLEGLSGEIRVNNKRYAGAMQPALLRDEAIADVLTFVRNSWTNRGDVVTPQQVAAARLKTGYKTFEALVAASQFPPLPAPPEGFALREVVRMPANPQRIASDGTGRALYVLTGNNGDVWRVDPSSGFIRQLLRGASYLEKRPGDIGGPTILVGMTMDKEGRLYIGSNQQNRDRLPVQNIVTIYRSTSFKGGDPIDPKPWFQTNYPGNFAFLHGLEGMAFGPDGSLYVANGARTDANQGGGEPEYYGKGETELTSAIWRIDPQGSPPTLEVFAKGIRNGYGLCFNDKGELFESENGPDAHAPEELNLIEKGRHYGFPYQFSDWTKKAYAHTPDAPSDLAFTLPIANVGPDGGYAGKPLYSFDPHSSPGGMTFLGDDFPEGWRGTLLMSRFGNFIREPKTDCGFDVLQITLRRSAAGAYEAQVRTALAPLGRPNDVHLSGRGKIYISEYSRGTNSASSYTLPGRILELSVKSKP